MPLILLPVILTANPNDPQENAAGLAGQIFTKGDTGFTDPRPLTTLTGAAIPGAWLTAGATGFLPSVYVDVPTADDLTVVWKSGDWVIPIFSYDSHTARLVGAEGDAAAALIESASATASATAAAQDAALSRQAAESALASGGGGGILVDADGTPYILI